MDRAHELRKRNLGTGERGRTLLGAAATIYCEGGHTADRSASYMIGIPPIESFRVQYVSAFGLGYSVADSMSARDSLSRRQQLRYTPLEAISVRRPVDRIAYIATSCASCRVLDLGAMDETAWQSKRGRGTWLHEEIALVARQVEGIDSSELVPATGLTTAPNARIRRGNIMDPEQLLADLEEIPDVIVAGELIEHLESPLELLRSFARVPKLAGRTLILSTPNATAVHNFLVGLARRESTHHDHLCILSYKTLNTLCQRAGFSDWEIIPYYARFTEMEERHSGLARLAVRSVERAVNFLEWLFPLLSFGYLVRVRL